MYMYMVHVVCAGFIPSCSTFVLISMVNPSRVVTTALSGGLSLIPKRIK